MEDLTVTIGFEYGGRAHSPQKIEIARTHIIPWSLQKEYSPATDFSQ